MPPAATLLFTLALTACAAGNTPRAQHARAIQAAEPARTSVHASGWAASRLGPPSQRGLGLRRIDRPNEVEPPLALY